MARDITRTRARAFVVGTACLAVLGVVLYVAFTANQGRLPGAPTTTVRAVFANIGQLQTGSDVRSNGIFVGRVSTIEVDHDDAVVTLVLNGDVGVHADARAEIRDQSALAQKFVELRTGTEAAGPLPGGTVPREQTESTHDLVDLLDVFEPDTRSALGTALRSLGGGAAGYGPGLHDAVTQAPAMVTGVGTITRTLSSEEARLPELLRSGDRLMGRFEGREAEIASLVEQTRQTMEALGVDGGRPLAETLDAAPGTIRHIRTAFDAIHQPVADTGAAMTDLRDGAVALGKSTPDLRGVLREAVPPLGRVPDVAGSAEPAVDELTRVFTDARPFVPRVADGLGSAAEPLRVLAPYARDMGIFSFDIGNLIENHNGWAHRLRIMAGAPGAPVVAGALVPDTNNPYPAPGQAITERDANGALVPGAGE